MKLTTILILGAAVLATPAFARAAADNNTASQTIGQSASTGVSSQTAMNTNSSSSGASVGNNSATSAVSSIPDTEKKYRNASRASDNRKEAETTKELNQQMANANGIPKT